MSWGTGALALAAPPPLLGAVPVLWLLMQTGISGRQTTGHRCLCQLSCPLHKIRPPQPSGQDGSALPVPGKLPLTWGLL